MWSEDKSSTTARRANPWKGRVWPESGPSRDSRVSRARPRIPFWIRILDELARSILTSSLLPLVCICTLSVQMRNTILLRWILDTLSVIHPLWFGNMSSDTDSEYDRRAYGQYASLAAEGDSDIDEEAALYLRSVRQGSTLNHKCFRCYFPGSIFQRESYSLNSESNGALWLCRQEAKALPDVMISEYSPEEAAVPPSGLSPQSANETPQAVIKADPVWIKQFMHDFLELRLSLQR